jgi:dGTP triphosphohydrolase
MRAYGGFEGNGQTLRILTQLDKYTESNGLDPTRRLILGVLKYPASYSEVVNESAYGQLESGSREWLFKSSGFKPRNAIWTPKRILSASHSNLLIMMMRCYSDPEERPPSRLSTGKRNIKRWTQRLWT